MTTSITCNGSNVIGLRLWMPWRGPWIADVDLDPNAVALAPTSGPAVILIGTTTLKGTVDPRGSGSFVSTARLRVIGGGGGWDKAVPAIHLHNDAGLLSTQVYQAAAPIVGEVVNDLLPQPVGIDFMRPAGRAAIVFGDSDWWVDLLGITNVGPRPPAIPDTSLQLMTWEPLGLRAEVACDTLVMPGTPLVDARLGGSPVTIRDVEQTFSSSGGSRATVFVTASKAVSRLTSAITSLVRGVAKTPFLKVYRYRVVLEGPDGRVSLQAVNTAAGMPDTLPISIWPGMSGDSAKLKPSTECLVEFLEGDPTKPLVRGFDPNTIPLERTLDATAVMHVGPSAAQVSLAGGETPIALAPAVEQLAAALTTFATGLNPTSLAGQASALVTAIAALPSPAALKSVAA